MKIIFLTLIAVTFTTITGCNKNCPNQDEEKTVASTHEPSHGHAHDSIQNKKTDGISNNGQTQEVVAQTEKSMGKSTSDASVQKIIDPYLALKNALTKDDNKSAKAAAKKLEVAIKSVDPKNLSADKAKIFTEYKEDMAEHAEHISDAPLDHQREHFKMLSEGMYEIVKEFGTTKTLYKDRCPMFDDKKGAIWLSETKEIRNPYYGAEMIGCGELEESKI